RALLVTPRRRVLPLDLARQEPAVPHAERERLEPRDAVHGERRVLVGAPERRVGHVPAARGGLAHGVRRRQERLVPALLPAALVVPRALALSRRRVARRAPDVVAREEALEARDRHLVLVEIEARHRRRRFGELADAEREHARGNELDRAAALSGAARLGQLDARLPGFSRGEPGRRSAARTRVRGAGMGGLLWRYSRVGELVHAFGGELVATAGGAEREQAAGEPSRSRESGSEGSGTHGSLYGFRARAARELRVVVGRGCFIVKARAAAVRPRVAARRAAHGGTARTRRAPPRRLRPIRGTERGSTWLPRRSRLHDVPPPRIRARPRCRIGGRLGRCCRARGGSPPRVRALQGR